MNVANRVPEETTISFAARSAQSVVGHYAQFHCSLGSDTRHSGEVMGGEGSCVLAPDWPTS